MPWLLDEILSADKPEWVPVPQSEDPISVSSPTYFPSDMEKHHVLCARLLEDRQRIGHFVRGPWGGGTAVVSTQFREVVESFEPGRHAFMRVSVARPDGDAFPSELFLLKVGEPVDDGIVIDQSDVRVDPHFNSLSAKTATPRLIWRGSRVRGRHLWTDRRLPSRYVVSDQLYEALKASGVTGIIAKESRIDETL